MRRRSLAITLAALLSLAAFSSVPAEAQGHGHGHGGHGGGAGHGGGGGYHGGGGGYRGHVFVRGGFGYYGYYGFYSPWSFYYGPFSPFWYPNPYFYPPYGGYGYGYGYGYMQSAVRIEVEPREAKVFVDGYYAGIVDDYDGTFQRLRIPPGKHEILVYLEGYKSLRQTMYLPPDSTYKIKGDMVKLGPGDPPEPPPTPPPPQDRERGGAPYGVDGPFGPPPPPPPSTDGRPGPPRAGEPPMMPGNTRFGRLVVRVQPEDAEIYIDGERWQTPDSTDRLVVNLVAGRHHVEVHKSGFDSFSTEVDVRPGEVAPVNVSLPSHH